MGLLHPEPDHAEIADELFWRAGRRFLCSDSLVRLLDYRRPRSDSRLRDEDISPEYPVEHYGQYDEKVLGTGAGENAGTRRWRLSV